eukprot:UN25135
MSNSLVVGLKEDYDFTHAPVTLFPKPLDRETYGNLASLSKPFGILVDRMSRDHEFLKTNLEHAAKGDPDFTGKMMSLYLKQIKDGKLNMVQPLQLGLLRSDYMEDSATKSFLQVEINTIASSFAVLSGGTSRLHDFLLTRHLKDHNYKTEITDPHEDFARTLGLAAQQVHPKDGCVLMVIQDGDKNAIDQRGLEYSLWKQFKIPMLRKTMAEVEKNGEVNKDNELIIDKRAISVVYFRAGYTPRDYPTENEWKAREKIEMSTAIKSPSVAQPNIMERYLDR